MGHLREGRHYESLVPQILNEARRETPAVNSEFNLIQQLIEANVAAP